MAFFNLNCELYYTLSKSLSWRYLVQVKNENGDVVPLSTKAGSRTSFFVDPLILVNKKEKATSQNTINPYRKHRIFVNKYEKVGTKSQNDKTAGWFSYEGID